MHVCVREELTGQTTDSSEDGEEEETSSRGPKQKKGGRKTKKIKRIKLVKRNKINKIISDDEKKNSVEKEGKAQNHRGKPEEILGATQKFGELYFYIKFQNKTKPVFVRAEENWRIF